MIGKEVLNYKIISLLGKGGMGAVYLAEHKLIENQKVAIKVINANMVNDFTRKMLKDEAEHLAGLHHQNIVTFHDYHIDEDGTIFLIMEYADGQSLESFINNVNGLIVEDRICPLFEPILDGVGYAHNKGILHRDIKPSNIVVTADGTPKILDFGIAKIMNETEGEQHDNLIMGTPSYMSPEQVRGDKLDARSDIYSLGVLLHQMLTGNAPYDTTTLTEHDINKLVVSEPLPRMRTYYKFVSEGMQKVVDKATAKNPDDRFQTCEEFKRALHNVVYPWKPKTWMKIAAVAAGLLVVGAGLWIWDFNRTKTTYFKDYVEVWGVPQGVHKLSKSEFSHRHNSYVFQSKRHKLQSVKFVNSYGKVIDQVQSEKNEIPVWQEFSYSDNGKISRVYVKNRSGRVLYVKSYNDKLNTMAYQFNDEHGTERTLSMQSTTSVDIEMDFRKDGKGRITRHWLEYDEKGYLVRVRYAGIDNSVQPDANGIYGCVYERNEKGLPVKVRYINADGEPKSTVWGMAIKIFTYNDDDDLVRDEYQTFDEQPAPEFVGGAYVTIREYDAYGNPVKEMYQYPDGSSMYPAVTGVAGVKNSYDDKGFLVQTDYLDADGNIMFVSNNGYATLKYEYDDNGYVSKMSSYDTEGKLIDNGEGMAHQTYLNDENGNWIEAWNYTSNDELVAQKGYSSAGFKCEYDSLGRQIEIMSYGVDRKPVPSVVSSPNCGKRMAYDDRDLLVRETYIDADGNVSVNDAGVSSIEIIYDNRGNMIRQNNYASDLVTPKANRYGVASTEWVYDEKGNLTDVNVYDVDGKPTIDKKSHTAHYRWTYDENGYVSSFKTFDLNDRLVINDQGIAGYISRCDNRGNAEEICFIGTDGKLMRNYLISRYKYDNSNNKTELSVFDGNNKPTTNQHKVHRYEYKYNSRNQMTEESCFGTNGKPTLNDEGWAVKRMDYDARGNMSSYSYFGTDGKPIKVKNGWSQVKCEYDAFGNAVKQCYYGTDGKPTDPNVVAPVNISQYDNRGNQILIAAQDGLGNYINAPGRKWSICRYEYDSHNNLTSESYFSSEDKPVLCPDGYHKLTQDYDDNNRLVTSAFFGTNGNPMSIEGYHKSVNKYLDNSDKVSEMAYFGTTGKPVKSDYGFHKVVIGYNTDRSLQVKRRYYDVDGTLIQTQVWNGSQWKTQRDTDDAKTTVGASPAADGSSKSAAGSSGGGWRNDVAELNKMCPYDYGEELGHLYMKSATATGDNECTLVFVFPIVSVSELDDATVAAMKTELVTMTKNVRALLDNKPNMVTKLLDKDGKVICTVRV